LCKVSGVLMKQDSRLKSIDNALLGVVSAVTQTPSKNVQKARLASSVATATLTKAATTAGIWGAVSTLGTAGTGTAIGTLSGAASTSATLAWIGGLVGGGMAAGAILLPVTGIAAGAAASMYVRRKLYGRPRKIDELHYFEEEILFASDNLLRPIDAVSQDGVMQPSADELRVFAHDGLLPLITQIEKRLTEPNTDGSEQPHAFGFADTVLPKYQKQLRKHCRVLRKHAEALAAPRRKGFLERFGYSVGRMTGKPRGTSSQNPLPNMLASVVLAVTFQRLLSNKLADWSLESDLVLEALKRSTDKLQDASVEELSAYVKGLTPDQLKGVVSNTKGIYHELLFANMHNASGAGTTAEVMAATNHPGADVQFFQDGDLVREIQLKAVSSPSSVYEHLERYPDIEILVTEEMASVLEGIGSSGLSNAILSRNVSERLEALNDEGLLDQVSDAVLTSAFVVAGFSVWRVVSQGCGQKFDFKPYLSNAGIAVGTSSVVETAVALTGN
jgi:hypothetical protein